MDTAQFFTLVLTTGVVTTLMNVAYSEFKEWRVRRRARTRVAGFLALQTAVALEAYVDICCDLVDTMDLDPGLEDEPYDITLPVFPGLPDTKDDGWRELAPKLAARCLAFPNQVTSAQGLVRLMDFDEGWREQVATVNEVDADQLPGEVAIDGLVEKETLKLARAAWVLASDLRAEYRLPEYVPAYDTLEWIGERLQQAESLETKRAEARKSFVALFPGKVTLMTMDDFVGKENDANDQR